MTTMIALVGGQTLPNVLPVLHYKPSNTLFLYTSTSKGQYINLKTMLEGKKFKVYGIETDPYDIPAIANTLSDALANIIELSSQPLMFNLTGGTKPMSLAAYQVAAQCDALVIYLQSEKGPNIVDHYNWQDHQLCFQQQEQLPNYLTLHDVLELHLGLPKDKAGKDVWKVDKSIDPTNLGQLFELAIEKTLSDHGYEVLRAVKGKNDQLDIDVMIRYQNQIGIIEAKTGKDGPPTGIYGVKQLSTAMRYLGGTYTRQFLVINGEPANEQRVMCELLKIHIISLPHYKQGMKTMSQEDIDILLTTIDTIMK